MKNQMTLLQNEQIELGTKNGLSEKQIRLYAKKKYNFLQMQELRQGLEAGLTRKQMRILLHGSLSHQEMNALRTAMEKGEIPYRPYPWILTECVLAAVLAGLGAGSMRMVQDRPYLYLEKEQIRLKQGEAFDPSAYIRSVSNRRGKLILPVDLDTSSPGHKAAVYRLVSREGEIIRILYVDVAET